MHLPRLSTHAGKLERYLGTEEVDRISYAMKDWYGRPILVANVPGYGGVWARAGGDFVGRIENGLVASLADRVREKIDRIAKAAQRIERRDQKELAARAGFSSLSDLISERTAGKGRSHIFNKVGTTGVVSATNSLWAVGAQPAAGANGSAAPGGRIPTSATTGGIPFTDPTGGDTQHFVRGDVLSTVAANTLLLYDRLFDVAKTMNSSATEAVTGVPTRYTSTTPSAADYAGNNFLFMECTTVLAATAHNWTVCTYTDESGNTGTTLPSLTGNSGNIVNRLDHPVGQWFAPLASGDTGIKNLTQMQCSALVATGAINFVIGHPLALLPMPVANQISIIDGINSAFSLERIFDGACLSFLEVVKPATTATTYAGIIASVAG